MKIENRKIIAQCWADILARGPTLLAWPKDNTMKLERTNETRCEFAS
jgi:hypothetical protein